MSWSWRVGRIAGIDIRVHATFLLLIGWIAWSRYEPALGWCSAVEGVVHTLLLFGVVVLHELGHSLTARRFGIQTRDITLLPIGGVASLERMPDEPWQELLVAAAGPAVNVVLAIVCYAIAHHGGDSVLLGANRWLTGPSISQLFWVNVSLAVFNLLPAFPWTGVAS